MRTRRSERRSHVPIPPRRRRGRACSSTHPSPPPVAPTAAQAGQGSPARDPCRRSRRPVAREDTQSDHGAPLTLARAQLAIAREYGFPSWPALVRHVEAIGGGLVRRPLIRPVELSAGRPYRLADGTDTTTDAVFTMFAAARDGEIESVRQLVARVPALATVEYNYTPPIHFAVREGHRHIVELLLDRGADPAYRSYPFQESLLTFADDRGYADIAELLRGRLSRRFALMSGTPAIIAAAARGDLAGVRAELAANPALARASNDTGDTPLHHAARNGHLDVVRALWLRAQTWTRCAPTAIGPCTAP